MLFCSVCFQPEAVPKILASQVSPLHGGNLKSGSQGEGRGAYICSAWVHCIVFSVRIARTQHGRRCLHHVLAHYHSLYHPKNVVTLLCLCPAGSLIISYQGVAVSTVVTLNMVPCSASPCPIAVTEGLCLPATRQSVDLHVTSIESFCWKVHQHTIRIAKFVPSQITQKG